MLSMETCVTPDGTVSYYNDGTTCASLGLQKYHWAPEPFHTIWMWLETPAGQVTSLVLTFAICVMVLEAKRYYNRNAPHAEHTA